MYRKILKLIGFLMALTLAFTVAFISVTGLMKVFHGVGNIGLAFFISIEVAKLVVTSLLHTFRDRLNILQKFFATLAIIIAMAITSLGCYGFLSASYKNSYTKLENVEAEVTLLEKRKEGYQDQLDVITNEKNSVNKTIAELTKGLSNNVIQYKDPESGEIITTTSSTTRKVLTAQLDKAIDRQSNLNVKADTLSSKIFNISNKILETKLSNEASNELGPLKYLSDISGLTMDEVMKWFIMLLIFIGDPLAVLLVIIYNKVIEDKAKEFKKKEGWFKRIFKRKSNDDGITVNKDGTLSVQARPIPIGPLVETNEEEWDEDHVHDMVMNEMVSDMDISDFDEEEEEKQEEDEIEFEEALKKIEEHVTGKPNLIMDVGYKPLDEFLSEPKEIPPPPKRVEPQRLDLTTKKVEEDDGSLIEEDDDLVIETPKVDIKKNLSDGIYHSLLEESDFDEEFLFKVPSKKIEPKKEESKEELKEDTPKPQIKRTPPRRRPGNGYMGIRRV